MHNTQFFGIWNQFWIKMKSNLKTLTNPDLLKVKSKVEEPSLFWSTWSLLSRRQESLLHSQRKSVNNGWKWCTAPPVPSVFPSPTLLLSLCLSLPVYLSLSLLLLLLLSKVGQGRRPSWTSLCGCSDVWLPAHFCVLTIKGGLWRGWLFP